MEDLSAIVVDNGSGVIKAGFAGDDVPRSIFPTVIARDTKGLSSSAQQSTIYIGDYAMAKRRKLDVNFSHPIERGIVSNWDDMESIWHFMYHTELKVDPAAQPVLLTEPPLNPAANREKMTQIMFEKFNVPAMYAANQALLSMCASGHTTGLILESGDGMTNVVPVIQGKAIDHATMRLDIGGSDLTDYLIKLLSEPYTLTDREIVRDIKEKKCVVANDFERDMQAIANDTRLTNGYELPDGDMIFIGTGRVKCTEAMFQPSLLGLETAGIHELVHKSITKCDVSSHKDLYGNIILSGGNAMFEGLTERLQKEVTALAPAHTRVCIVAPPERKCSVWIGGSILGSLSMEQIWITKAEYDECGPSVVRKQKAIIKLKSGDLPIRLRAPSTFQLAIQYCIQQRLFV